MVIRYLDPEFGNDANDGLTFANRKLTLSSATAGLTGGDEVRVISSQEDLFPTQLTWTDNTITIPIPAGTVKTINDFSTAWTHSANVTGTTHTNRKIGATSPQINIQAAFTTGKASYFTLPSTVDLSGFQCISFWFAQSNLSGSTNMRIVLCSDATGDTPVHTITIPDRPWIYNNWRIWFFDNGAPLSSTINSVAIYVDTDVGASNLTINNMIACKARSAADHISHMSLLSLKTAENPEYYPIQSITESEITIGGHSEFNTGSTGIRTYRIPSSGTFDTYVLKPIPTRWLNAEATVGPAGVSSSNLLKISGGWNRTDMSTQDGVSWLSFLWGFDWPIYKNWLHLEKIGYVAPQDAQANNFLSGYYDLEGLVGSTANANNLQAVVPQDQCLKVKIKQVVGCRVENLLMNSNSGVVDIEIDNYIRNFSTLRVGTQTDWRGGSFRLGKYYNNSTGILPFNATEHHVFLHGVSFKYNSEDISLNVNQNNAVLIQNCMFDTTPLVTNHATNNRNVAILSGVNNNHGDVRIFRRGLNVVTDNVVTNSIGRSWKISPTLANISSDYAPIKFKLGAFAVRNGILTTVRAYVRRDHATEINGGIMLEEGWIGGVNTDREYITVGADTWEQLSISFTPTNNGIIPIFGFVFSDATNRSFWFDDLSAEE